MRATGECLSAVSAAGLVGSRFLLGHGRPNSGHVAGLAGPGRASATAFKMVDETRKCKIGFAYVRDFAKKICCDLSNQPQHISSSLCEFIMTCAATFIYP